MRDLAARRAHLVEHGHLAHDGFGFGRLGVGDVDGVALFETDLVEFGSQHFGREVLGELRQFTLAVGKRGFNHQRAHFQTVDALPERRIAFGIARKHPPGRPRLGPAHGVAAGGHGVVGGQRLDGAAAYLTWHADLDGMQRDDRRLGRRQARKIGPDDVVEHVGAQRLQCFRQRVHAQRTADARCGHGIQHERQAGDVVHVGMGEEHIVDTQHLLPREVAHTGSGIDQHVLIDQERRGLAVPGNGARAAQHAYPHEKSLAFLDRRAIWYCPWPQARAPATHSCRRLHVRHKAGKGNSWHFDGPVFVL